MRVYHNEIDKAACSILRRHFPESLVDQRSIEDVTTEDLAQYQQCHFFAGIGGFSDGFRRAGIPANFNVWSGGFPCQDLSVAGLRAGLAGARSGLYFQFHRLVSGAFPRWVVLENVPGLLSSNKGRDFALVIGGLTGIVPEIPAKGWGNAGFFRGPFYSVAYRVLDAQFFGVAQRRRRVFIVASFGNGRCAQVLFERESLPGDTPPRRETGKRVTRIPEISPALSSEGHDSSEDGRGRHALIPTTFQNTGQGYWQAREVGQSIRTPKGCGSLEANLVAFGGNNTGGDIEVSTTLSAHGSPRHDFASDTFVAFNIQHNDGGEHKRKDRPNGGLYVKETDTALTVGTTDLTAIKQPFGVRRLTPTECERLQGFPDGWTDGQSDSTRYRQLGNAVAVPVIEWIGLRILKADNA